VSKPAKSLSPEAVAQLVEGHREFLAFLERRVESRAAAEDILQAAFARGLERGAGVQDDPLTQKERACADALLSNREHAAIGTGET
jgi:hypothetical protein